jgi:hypothetical protein
MGKSLKVWAAGTNTEHLTSTPEAFARVIGLNLSGPKR